MASPSPPSPRAQCPRKPPQPRTPTPLSRRSSPNVITSSDSPTLMQRNVPRIFRHSPNSLLNHDLSSSNMAIQISVVDEAEMENQNEGEKADHVSSGFSLDSQGMISIPFSTSISTNYPEPGLLPLVRKTISVPSLQVKERFNRKLKRVPSNLRHADHSESSTVESTVSSLRLLLFYSCLIILRLQIFRTLLKAALQVIQRHQRNLP